MPVQIQADAGVALLAVFIGVPKFASYHLTDYTTLLAYVMLFLSLGLLVRTSGQVSLCHMSFMAISVSGLSHLAVDHHCRGAWRYWSRA